jgi:hypothetical protein
MNNKQLVSAFGLLLAGILLGQFVSARAQSAKPFRECVGAQLVHVSANTLNVAAQVVKTLKIPAGWTPIGGASSGDQPLVVLCR